MNVNDILDACFDFFPELMRTGETCIQWRLLSITFDVCLIAVLLGWYPKWYVS